ncbi:DUF4382 domain-containing protein [Haloparvum sp. AD34]
MTQRRNVIKGVGAAVTAGLAGCTGNDSASDGTTTDGSTEDSSDDDAYGLLSTSITDQPNDIGDFESLIVTIDGIWVKPDAEDAEDGDMDGTETETETETADETETATATESTETATETDSDATETEEEDGMEDSETEEDDVEDSETEEDGENGRRYIEFEEPQEADLVELQDGNTALIDETELEVGTYKFLQLNVSNTEGTLTDGSEAEVETPGNAPLKFNQSFDIRQDVVTNFLADFAPHKRGNGSYIIRPVASGTEVTYTDSTATADGTETSTTEAEGDATATETTATESTATESTATESTATEQAGTEDGS